MLNILETRLLSLLISTNSGVRLEIERRFIVANKAFYVGLRIMCSKLLSINTKLRIYERTTRHSSHMVLKHVHYLKANLELWYPLKGKFSCG